MDIGRYTRKGGMVGRRREKRRANFVSLVNKNLIYSQRVISQGDHTDMGELNECSLREEIEREEYLKTEKSKNPRIRSKNIVVLFSDSIRVGNTISKT